MPDNLPDDFAGDAALLRRFAIDHSEAAFAAFVRRRIDFVYGVALRRTAGDAHLAGEIAQTVFLLASQKAPTLACHTHLAGWLHATTSLSARSALRDARLRRQREQEAAAMNEFLNTPDIAPAAAVRMRDMLDDALGLLGQKDRDALLLRFFEGRPFAEVGAAMKTNEDAARKRVARALEKLRALYARRGVTSTAAALGAFMAAEAATAAPAGLAGFVSGAILAGGGAVAATATATLTTGGGVLAFMTSTKIAITATVAALIVATVATVEVRREKTAADDLASLRREHATLVKKLGNTQIEAKGFQNRLENFRREKTEAAEYANSPHALDPVEKGKAILAQHPEIQAMLEEERNATTAKLFYSLRERLNLTPEQFAEIVDLTCKTRLGLTNYSRDIPGIGKIAFQTGIPIDGDESKQAWVRLKEVAGPSVDDEGNLCIMEMQTQDLKKQLYNTDAPLSTDQMAQLNQMFLTAEMKSAKDWSDVGYRGHWDEMLKEAGAFLSEPQMAALKQMRERQNLHNAKWNLERAARNAAKQAVANAGTEARAEARTEVSQ